MHASANSREIDQRVRPNNSFKPRPLRGSACVLACSTPPFRKAVRLNSGVRALWQFCCCSYYSQGSSSCRPCFCGRHGEHQAELSGSDLWPSSFQRPSSNGLVLSQSNSELVSAIQMQWAALPALLNKRGRRVNWLRRSETYRCTVMKLCAQRWSRPLPRCHTRARPNNSFKPRPLRGSA